MRATGRPGKSLGLVNPTFGFYFEALSFLHIAGNGEDVNVTSIGLGTIVDTFLSGNTWDATTRQQSKKVWIMLRIVNFGP